MAVLTRDKSTVYGLSTDLLALQNADITLQGNIDSETSRATTAEETNATAISNEVTARGLAITNEATARSNADTALDGRLDVVEGADTVVGSIAKAEKDSKAYADTVVAALANGRITDLETLTTLINADSSTAGSFRKAIADVVGVAPEALNTLKEIADSINNDATLYDTLVNLVNTSISDLNAEVLGTATTAMDTLGEIEAVINIIRGANNVVGSIAKAEKDAGIYADAAVLVEKTRAESAEALKLAIASNLSDVENVATARTNLDVYSKSEASALATSGGAVFITEAKTVTADKIVLTNAPKNGVIFNFATVRHVDSNFVSYDIPVTVTATAGGKEFLLSPNTSGQFDSKLVQVQYAYTAV